MASRADIEAGRAFVTAYLKSAEFVSGLNDMEQQLASFTKRVLALGIMLQQALSAENVIKKTTSLFEKLGDAISETAGKIGSGLQAAGKKAAMVGGVLGTSILGAASHFAHTGDSLAVLSDRLGASTQLLSGLGFAARQTGADIGDVETGFRMLQKTIGEAAGGSKDAVKALAKAGVTVKELIALSPDEQFRRVAAGLAVIEDQAIRTEAAIDIFGRSGQKLLPMLTNLRGLLAEAFRLGLIVTPGQVALADQLDDKFQALKDAAFAGAFAVGEALAPALLECIKVATDLAVKFRQWVNNNKETVQLVAKIAVGLVAVGASVSAIGIGFKAVGGAVSVATKAFSLFGSAVSMVATAISAIGAIVFVVSKFSALAAMFPIIGTTATAVAGAFSGGLMAAVGAVGSALSVVFFKILLPAVAIVSVITAGLVAMAAAAVAGAVAFWKLADPITALTPLAKSVFESLKNITGALSKGDFAGAAAAMTEGMKQAIRRGTSAILQMVQNTMQRLPGFVSSVLSGTEKMVSAFVGEVKATFADLWPAIQASFAALSAMSRDVFAQLPQLAGWAVGKIVRAFITGFVKIQQWLVNMQLDLIKALVGLGPKIIKAIFTGDFDSIAKELKTAFAGAMFAGGVISGVMDADAPQFKPSADTIAAWGKLADGVQTAKSSIEGRLSGGGGPTGGGGRGVGGGDAPKWLDPTPLEKYKARLKELLGANLSPEQLAAGLAQLKRETLGIEPTPLQAFRDRLLMLNEGLKHSNITFSEWRAEVAKAQREILGVEPTNLQKFSEEVKKLAVQMQAGAFGIDEYTRRLKKLRQEILGEEPTKQDQLAEAIRNLRDQMIAGAFGYDEFLKRAEKARRDIFGVDPTPIQKYADALELLRQQLHSGAFGKGAAAFAEFQRRAEKARKDAFGIEPTELEVFIDRMRELENIRAFLKPGEFASEMKKIQQALLGFDPTPLETFEARLKSLHTAFMKLSPDQQKKTFAAYSKAAFDALPPDLQEIVQKTKTPAQKKAELDQSYAEKQRQLQIFRGSNPTKEAEEHFQRSLRELQKNYFADLGKSILGDRATAGISSAGTFSAAGAQGLGIGGISDKGLREQMLANELLRDIRTNTKRRPKLS